MYTSLSSAAPTLPWEARWFLWDGGFLAVGVSTGTVPPHAHHAIQIAFGLDRDVALRVCEGGEWSEWLVARAILVRPDGEHSFDGLGALTAMLFLDPETIEGRWLLAGNAEPMQPVAPARLENALPLLRRIADDPPDAQGVALLIDQAVRALCSGPRPSRHVDERVLRALEFIRSADAGSLSLDDVAAHVFLSPSRFQHLFKEQLGLPFRRYLLWRKLTRALLAVGRGMSLSAAAHAAGFSDSAHFTRTCYQMFGIPPSFLIGRGVHHEIPAPFELPLSAE